ncbi:HlyU family transcriptional regulator [Larsenimonas suaedae]|uniref:HlyU family transcriptional regulator n=1 Tax=Larsenimonas suaedae TaxID=1851019 RepID=A0ABU1GXG8_9GAMM|nr:HlyU family transcriptional regulator [Larsenimonas suaedae]MCM2971497.1 HlyU family transcriptional regulator [Larsenimonas suaedae]MDR5896753.1 HlyU family transcriptional regulator [Larsenimonas suaedae]
MFKRLLSALSGGREKAAPAGTEAEATEYNGYWIVPVPQPVGGQFRVSGLIKRTETDEAPYRFERSDMLPDREGCIELTRQKAHRLIDEQGPRLFEL